MARYSFSQISSYQTCPMKYKFEKVDGIKPLFETNLYLIRGTACHRALEWLYQQISLMKTPSREDFLDQYTQEWNQHITKLQEGRKSEGKPLESDQTLEEMYEAGLRYVERYWEQYTPFQETGVVFETEKNVSFDLGDEIYFTGKIDRIDMIDDTLVINDYKTNKKILDDEHDKIAEQINLYGYGMLDLYRSKFQKVRGRVYYLHFNKAFDREITPEIIQSVKEKYLALSKEIEQAKKLFAKGDTTAFPTKVGLHCESCPFKHMCPAWVHQTMEDERIEAMDGQSVRQLIDKYKQADDQMKILEEKKKFYKELLVAYAKNHQLKVLFSSEYKALIATRKTLGYEAEQEQQLEKLLKEL